MSTVLITGGTGLIGTALCERLLSQGHSLIVLSRDSEAVNARYCDSDVKAIANLDSVNNDERIDAIINLAGEPIANKRWSDKQKQRILNSRLGLTANIVAFIKRVNVKPAVLVSGSAIGYYGIGVSDQPIVETDTGDQSFSSSLCKQWESCAKEAESLGVRTCLLRTGVVLSADGGALAKMLPPFKLGLGGSVGNGQQWMPWIHLSDMVSATIAAMNNADFSGPINCTAPNPIRNAEFAKALGRALNRPAALPMPAFAVRLLFGQMGEELLLAGKRVVPKKLLCQGFEFMFDDIDAALADIV